MSRYTSSPLPREFLVLLGTAADLHLPTLRAAIGTIPEGLLGLDGKCRPIITDYSDPGKIFLGYGFHHRDFSAGDYPRDGLVFEMLNPSLYPTVKNVQIHGTTRAEGTIPVFSSFTVMEKRDFQFYLTPDEYDLDVTRCIQLKDGKPYEK
ncbi:hypothetical protein A3K63_02370 [Candidatus Micrarchaeota archaeon RBG_16_49_10]|nr:MAG: hypothetical protein A3K63_02370 [Candidatus Micrarchaeota archaeon RBG_16_49_10]